ncbi:uncharacterized protein LOC116431956 [Nomia melanderi]|uniref:uncharacterized protein LOC116431956 n=1 Tax=Nomia melanderi TaxID=2448451 RepID=UPI001304416D|nr:uncharacterized protein LOC116431956 [Nomia melanderi]
MPAARSSLLFTAIEFVCLFWVVGSANDVNGTVCRSRREFEAKYLVFPEGSNVQLVYCLTLTTYAEPTGFSTVGITAGQAWELPSESTLSQEPPDVYHRRSRRELYRKMESLLGTRGKDGRACVLKAICKASERNRKGTDKGTFLEEIMRVVFSLPGEFEDADTVTGYERAYYRQENCDAAEDRCPDVF